MRSIECEKKENCIRIRSSVIIEIYYGKNDAYVSQQRWLNTINFIAFYKRKMANL